MIPTVSPPAREIPLISLPPHVLISVCSFLPGASCLSALPSTCRAAVSKVMKVAADAINSRTIANSQAVDLYPLSKYVAVEHSVGETLKNTDSYLAWLYGPTIERVTSLIAGLNWIKVGNIVYFLYGFVPYT